MAYVVVVQGATLEAFQAAKPVIDDIPAGTAMRIEFVPPGWGNIRDGVFYTEQEQSALYLKYWYDVAMNNLEGADTMHVTKVYRSGDKVVIDGYATGFPVLLAVVLIVACISAVAISGFTSFQNIKVSADMAAISKIKAGVSADLSKEIALAISKGFTPDQIASILKAQSGATDAVEATPTTATSFTSDISSLLKWGIIGFLAFQALGLFKEIRGGKKAAAEA
jgi:hypothetical protein